MFQWSDPGSGRGILENPTTAIFNSTSQELICKSRCEPRKGWNPSDEVKFMFLDDRDCHDGTHGLRAGEEELSCVLPDSS